MNPPRAPMALSIPRIGLGVFRAPPEEAYAAVRSALVKGFSISPHAAT